MFLHLTEADLARVRARVGSGPFRWFGDAFGNSPGDWERVKAAANAFVAQPALGHVAASFPEGWFNGSAVAVAEGEELGAVQHRIVSAGFYALVADDAAIANVVASALVAQAAEPTLQWGDDPPFDPSRMNDVLMVWAEWVMGLLHAYDYVKGYMSAGDRAALDAWFYAAADLFRRSARRRASSLFVAPGADDYTLTSEGAAREANVETYAYIGGPNVTLLNLSHNNRSAKYEALALLVGAFLNDESLIADAKRGVQEHLMFGVYPDGTPTEFCRWTDGLPDLGWAYSHYWGVLGFAAYSLWVRRGDASLLSFETSAGIGATAGGPKSILKVGQALVEHMNGGLVRHAHSDLENISADTRIDGYDVATGWWPYHPASWLPANRYWEDALLDGAIFRRQGSGTFAYPSDHQSEGSWPTHSMNGLLPCLFLPFATVSR